MTQDILRTFGRCSPVASAARQRPPRETVLLAALVITLGCSRSNNLILGRVEATVGGHDVVVTDCYRTSVPQPTQDGSNYCFAPCRDAVVQIRSQELTVNGRKYAHLKPHEAVTVDHGVVLINNRRPGP